MHPTKTQKLGEILFEEGLINHQQLLDVLETQKIDNRKLGRILVEKGFVTDDQLAQTLARSYHLPFIKLKETAIDEKLFDSFPQELIQKYKVIPICLKDKHLVLATNDPLNLAAIQEIQYKSSHPIELVMASLTEIEDYLSKLNSHFLATQAFQSMTDKRVQGTPIQSLVESIVTAAIRERASDIHLEPQREKLRIRFRIDGQLYERKPISKELERNIISRIKIISGMDVAENRRPQDGRTTISYEGAQFDLRISSLPDMLGENLSIRILNKKFVHRAFEELGMTNQQSQLLHQLIQQPHGLILVTGPTGAGKTTTLYSILNVLNQTTKNIISIEDPVEYEIKGITQTNISKLTGYTFATAIRNILRHDPDIIMVREIRDVETAEIAIRAALTGHLVLSTIHTNTAAGAITRLLEMNIEPFLISSAVNGVIAQRLVRHLCPHCREIYQPNESVLTRLRRYGKVDPHLKLAKAVGCAECLKIGFSGRAGVFETLKVDEDIRSLILKSAEEREVFQKSLEKGMQSLAMAGIQKATDHVTSLEEILGTIFIE